MSNVSVAKKYEQQIADATGGKRRAKKSYGDSCPDVLHDLFIGECKLRAKIAAVRWLEQAELYALGDERFAVLFCREKHKRLDDTVVMVRLPDFIGLIERGK